MAHMNRASKSDGGGKHVLKDKLFLSLTDDLKIDGRGQVLGVVGSEHVIVNLWRTTGGYTWAEQRLVRTTNMLGWRFYDELSEWNRIYNAAVASGNVVGEYKDFSFVSTKHVLPPFCPDSGYSLEDES